MYFKDSLPIFAREIFCYDVKIQRNFILRVLQSENDKITWMQTLKTRRQYFANSEKMGKRPDIHLSDLKRAVTLNIGTILFGALFIYMVISIIMYLTAAHIAPYQVTSGPLSKNQTYTALILRSEQLCTGQYRRLCNLLCTVENSKVKSQGRLRHRRRSDFRR